MNATAIKPATVVAKEEISSLKFPKNDVLTSPIQQLDRNNRIIRAMKLGNNGKVKVEIIFEDEQGLKKVETTVWGVTEKNIILKKGTLVPINRIHEIKYF